MNFDNFTIKSQEVVQQAVQTAQQNGNQAIEPEHLLKALLDKGESVVKFVFQKLGVNQQPLRCNSTRRCRLCQR